MRVQVCVPRAPSGPERDRLHEWTARAWEKTGLKPVFASDGSEGEVTTDRFSHPRAINAAVGEGDPTDVLVIADADTFPDITSLEDRIYAANEGRWSCPAWYVNLSEQTTVRILEQAEYFRHAVGIAELSADHVWQGGTSWAGVVVVRRDQFDAVGGYDERFDGWAADDIAFAMSMETMHGPVTRMGTVYHLYHEVDESKTRGRPGFRESWDLTARYMKAHNNRARMMALIGERQ